MSDNTISSVVDEAKKTANSLKREAVNGLHATQDELRRRVEESKVRLNTAIDETADRVDAAHMYLKEQARERPIAVTLAAVGAGLVIGMLLSGGRRR
ncbi:MAG: hypothetical protein AB7M12_00800 [Hyphomonadaceae bacterium]